MKSRDEIIDIILNSCFYRNPQYVRDIITGKSKPAKDMIKEAKEHFRDASEAADRILA